VIDLIDDLRGKFGTGKMFANYKRIANGPPSWEDSFSIENAAFLRL